jgi:Transposase zinc-binding domain
VAYETAACDERRAPVASLGYTPRQAEHTVLHQVIREHLETFLATAARADPAGLPAFLEQEFRGFLDCGVWARGFARFQCQGCHAETLVPFSCMRLDGTSGVCDLAPRASRSVRTRRFVCVWRTAVQACQHKVEMSAFAPSRNVRSVP